MSAAMHLICGLEGRVMKEEMIEQCGQKKVPSPGSA